MPRPRIDQLGRCILSLLVAGATLAIPAAVLAAGDQAEEDRPAAAEQAPPQKPSPHDISFLTAYRFHLSAASIRSDDPRFDWDAYFGGDIDIVDYGYGRINFLADYETVLGHEIRRFDPNQGNYHLDTSASWRFGSAELLGVFHHVSRHLGDRANLSSVAWNTLGVKAIASCACGPTTTSINVRGARVMQKAFVDYTWQVGGGGEVQHRLSPRYDILGRGDLEITTVDRAIAGRGTQLGMRLEAAIRLRGAAAGVEAFAAIERRLDPYPIERATRTWPVVGFRFVSR